MQRAHHPRRREHCPGPVPLGHRRRKVDAGKLPGPGRALTRQVSHQERGRLSQPHAGVDQQVGEGRVALIVPTPPGRVHPPVRQPAAQTHVPPGQVVGERNEAHRRWPGVGLGLRVDPHGPQSHRSPHRLVQVTKRLLREQILRYRPRRPLVQRGHRTPPGRHRHLRLPRSAQPHLLKGAQVRGITGPDLLPVPAVVQKPAEQHHVPGISGHAAGRTHAPAAQLPEEPVQRHVIAAVGTEHERLAGEHPSAGKHHRRRHRATRPEPRCRPAPVRIGPVQTDKRARSGVPWPGSQLLAHPRARRAGLRALVSGPVIVSSQAEGFQSGAGHTDSKQEENRIRHAAPGTEYKYAATCRGRRQTEDARGRGHLGWPPAGHRSGSASGPEPITSGPHQRQLIAVILPPRGLAPPRCTANPSR